MSRIAVDSWRRRDSKSGSGFWEGGRRGGEMVSLRRSLVALGQSHPDEVASWDVEIEAVTDLAEPV